MAQINLKTGETQGSPLFPVGTNNDFVDAPGSSGETVYIANGTQNFGATFNDGGDTIVLSGSASQFQVSRSGSTITLTNGAGLTVTFPVPDSSVTAANATRFVFNNGTATNTADDQTYTLTNTGTSINFTNTASGSTAQPITLTPTTIGGGTQAPALTVNVAATDVDEGGTIVYTFTLSSPQANAVTINVATSGGTATPGSDYTPVSTAITFAPGQTTQFLTVQTLADNIPEPAETVAITVTGVALAPNADLVAQINAQGEPPRSFILTTGNDTFTGGDAADRFVGAQTTTEPGKLLSANDILNGGNGNDTLELTNAPGGVANVLADIDFTNVTSIETLVTNYATVQLGAQANKAGITTVDTATRTDAQNAGNVGIAAGTTLDLTSDANGDGVVDFNRPLTVTMANSAVDSVRLSLAAAAGSSINTGSTFTPSATNGNPNPVAVGGIDNVNITNQTNPVRVTFTSTAVGNGTAFNADGTTLAVAVQSEDANDNLVGGIVRFDDEGLRFAGGQFDVRDVSGTARGTFNEVILGTNLADTYNSGLAGVINANLPAGSTLGSYINAGAGNDTVNGSANADFLVGGAGDDQLNGGLGVDSILGGAGNDVINGGGGIDALLDGGEGSDTYVYADGEFVANEVISDSGVTAGDIDYLAITSSTPLTDAQFAGRLGIEGLATNVTPNTAAVEVTIGANAQASGIRTVYTGDDDLSATAYTADLTVYGRGATVAGAGNDTIVLQNQTAQQATLIALGLGFLTSSAGNFNSAAGDQYFGSVDGGAGNDTVIAGYALQNNNTTLTGGAGTDTLVLGGAVNGQGGTLAAGTNLTGANAYTLNFGTGFTGFEAITLNAAPAGSAVSYTITVGDANIASGTTLTVNGSALRAGVSVAGTTVSEVLNFSANGLSADRGVNVTGGAAADVLSGGQGVDTLFGGAGNDTLIGRGGTDRLDGGEGSDTYVYFDTELTAAEVIVDTGTAGTDTINVTSATALTDALFANKTGVEALTTNVTVGATGDLTAAGANAEVTIGASAQAAGIRTVNNGNDDLDASGYTAGLTVNTGTGSVTTGSGADVVNLTDFTTSAFRLGAGDDTLNASYFVNGGNIADGGAGIDTVTLGGSLTPVFAPFNGSITVNLTANFVNFERAVFLPTENARSVTGANNDVPGSAVQWIVTTDDANVAAGVTFTVDASALGSTTTGLGADGEVDGTGANADTTTFSTLTFNGSAEKDGNFDITGGAGNDVLTGGAGADFIRGGAGADQLNGGAGNDTLEGGDGNDILTGGAGFDILRGGANDDTIVMTVTEFNSDADQVDGGTGNDTLQINGTAAAQDIADVGFNGRFTSIEQVLLVGAAGGTAFNYTAGFYSESSGVRNISLGANASGSAVSVASYASSGATLNDVIVTTNNATFIGSALADTFNLGVTNTALGGGTDSVTAGAGDDVINFGSTLTTADLVNGGAGNDTLNVSGNGTTSTVTVSMAAIGGATPTSGVFSVETLNLATGLAGAAGTTVAAPGTAGTATSYNVTVSDNTSFDSATAGLTVNGGALRVVSIGAGADGIFGTADDATTGEVLTFDGSAVSGGHVLNVTGGAANDSITGGLGNDILNGGAGADFINGGAGNDTIDGGAGNDNLLGGAGNDIITGGLGQDTISGGFGIDTINLGNDGARDTVLIVSRQAGADGILGNADDTFNPEAPRADQAGIETINGYATGARGVGVDGVAGTGDDTFTATADVIDFGSAIVSNAASTSLSNGMVVQTSVLGTAVEAQTTLLAAIQLVEQEFNNNNVIDNGRFSIAFQWHGNTYVGEITDTNAAAGSVVASFTDIAQVSGVTGVTGLVDADGAAGAGTAFGLYI